MTTQNVQTIHALLRICGSRSSLACPWLWALNAEPRVGPVDPGSQASPDAPDGRAKAVGKVEPAESLKEAEPVVLGGGLVTATSTSSWR